MFRIHITHVQNFYISARHVYYSGNMNSLGACYWHALLRAYFSFCHDKRAIDGTYLNVNCFLFCFSLLFPHFICNERVTCIARASLA